MQPKPFIVVIVALIVLAGSVTFFLLKKIAHAAQEQHNKILNDFKAVDENLRRTQQQLDTSMLAKDSPLVK
jgi:F0F1-type ATP synthase membrane subunit b/b'